MIEGILWMLVLWPWLLLAGAALDEWPGPTSAVGMILLAGFWACSL